MKLAIQIISWITVAIYGLLILSSLGGDNTELLVGSVVIGALPVINLIFLDKKGKEIVIQTIAWINIAIYGLMFLSYLGSTDSSILVWVMLVSVLPILDLIYFGEKK